MKFLLLISLFAAISNLALKAQEYNDLILSYDDNIIHLEKDLSYFYLTSSNKFLAFYEGYTNQIYFQNLNNGISSKVEFRKGRGPNEILLIRGLAVIDNYLFILDVRNSKILKYSLKDKSFESEFALGRNRISFITASRNTLYGKGINRDGIYFKIDIDNNKIEPLINSLTQQEIIELSKNIFRFEGPFLANSEYLISIRVYETSMFVQKMNGEYSDFKYDQTKKEPEYEFDDNFGRAIGPPLRVNMKLNDAALKPNSTIAYLSREGYTKKYPENNRSVLYQYDFIKREYVGILETEIESIGKIATNDKYLFIYDDKNFTIKRVEL